MKLCSFIHGGEHRVGALGGSGIVDLTSAGIKGDINDIIRGGFFALDEIRKICEGGAPTLPEKAVEFGIVSMPEKIVCVGLNYKGHAEETGGAVPEHPVLFSKFNDSLCPSGKAITLPPWQRCYDYEAELVIIIGKEAWNVPEEEAMDYIFGYTCGNDLSARDCQFLSNQWLIGKSFPDFAPAGPYIVTADSFDPYKSNGITCEVNGAIAQSSETGDMIFGCGEIVSYASHYFRLAPGDLIFTGTPSGVILGKEKSERVWLSHGDVVRVTIDGIGALENTLV